MDRCGHVAFNPFHREYRRCTYRCRRDAIHLHRTTQHQFEIPCERDLGFPASFRSNSFSDVEQEQEQTKFQGVLDDVAGECNVSSRSLAESSAIHFVRSILDIGMSLDRACPTITSELRPPTISAKKISSEIRSSGEARAADILGQYRARRFANLVCNAGTVQRLHTVYALVTSPYCESPPLVASIVDSGGFDGDDYARFLASSLS
jgi:hypothetical protein